jgi:hypothetical protein
MTSFADTFDTNTPQGSDNPAEADDRMREIKAGVQERMNVCNYWPLTGTEVSDPDAGENRKILFHEPISTPGAIAENHGQLYIKDVSDKAELHWIDEDEQEIQLTSAGSVLLTSGLLPNNVFLTAVDFAGTGKVDIIGVNASDEVVIFHETAHPAQLSSSDAPVSDEDISNKKYVDDAIAAAVASVGFWKTNPTVGTPVFNGSMSSVNVWQDLDLSSVIGVNAALCFFELTGTGGNIFYAKPKGFGSATIVKHFQTSDGETSAGFSANMNQNDGLFAYFAMPADSAGKIQVSSNNASDNFTLKLIGYVK